MYKLRDLRSNQGLSQRDLARATGIAQTTISRWETEGRGMPIDKAVDIANALGCKVDDLVDKETSPGIVLDNEEWELVQGFGLMDRQTQMAVLQIVRSIVGAQD